MSKRKHTYPSRYPPGSHGWELDEAWWILDTLEPGELNVSQRSWLAGLITGALVKAQQRAREENDGNSGRRRAENT